MNTTNEALFAEVLERNTRITNAPPSAPAEPFLPVVRVDVDVEAALVRGLAESAVSVFSTMCGISLVAGEQAEEVLKNQHHHLSGIISLSGRIKATIVVSMEQNVVFAAADGMLGLKPTSVNADIIDLVGELANMVAGNAKDRMKIDGVCLGLPTVVAGNRHRVAYNSEVSITTLHFTSEFGPLLVEFGLA